MPYDFSPSGELIEDELVEFNFQEEINGTDYYIGFLSNMIDGLLIDENQENYGAWTGAGKTGDKRKIYLLGEPALNDEITILIDKKCKILSKTNTPLYFNYIGHGEILWRPKFSLYFLYEMTAGEIRDWIVRPIPRNTMIKYFTWRVDGLILPNDNITLQLRDALNGGGDYRELNLGVVNGENRQGKLKALSSEMFFDTSKSLVIRGDGKDISNLYIDLF